MQTQRIKKCQEKHQHKLFDKANVVSVGHGYRVKDNEGTGELCLVAGVAKKVDKSTLGNRDILPDSIDGIKIDVVEVGYLEAFAKPKRKAVAQEVDPTGKFRPAQPGVSIGHKNITAGTFGCVVRKNGERFILSNNHVLANSNNALIGDAIYQPGTADGGTSNDQIGILEDFIPIVFAGGDDGGGGTPTCPIAKSAAGTANFFAKIFSRKHRLVAVNIQATTNFIDAALARPLTDADIIDDIVQIGIPVGISDAALGMDLQKYGRTTKYTTGQVLQLGATVQVSYGPGKLATFTNQIIAGAMSAGGDSGSAVLDMDKNLVGLLYAGSTTSTILNPMSKVFDLLGVTL